MADNEMLTGFLAGQSDDGRNSGMDGMGGGWWIFAIILFAMIFGYGRGWGMNGSDGNGAVTRAEMCSEFSFQDVKNGVRGIQQGLCDGFYAMNTGMLNGFHGVDNAVCKLGYQTQQGFNGVERGQCQQGYQIQQGFGELSRQMSDCCCETQRMVERGFCDTNYNLATHANNIMQAGHCDTDRVIAKLDAMENARQAERLEALRLENQTLRFQLSQNAQNAVLSANNDAQTAELIRRISPAPVPSYQVPAPYPFCGNSWGGCGCGCA